LAGDSDPHHAQGFVSVLLDEVLAYPELGTRFLRTPTNDERRMYRWFVLCAYLVLTGMLSVQLGLGLEGIILGSAVTFLASPFYFAVMHTLRVQMVAAAKEDDE
jgi:hypothetical protein